ncbi:N-formylglutamate amidohydrolase [Haliangium ochraceum]|uniref:N-formylglutamate amidohydrolase n=1 Tax=Haliangium ochraceum (strain DSM 14365 / JCM 11303 / SMP-2) TaxID=502025 RepID=D0LHA2_HALO1|nr:N-formylglutamate amidohydrolase [Haliangium ochraceum]ACY18247.1 N-formylglutamate amidohydrolase [Haliangium ochraceum DSM 14365]
MDDSNPPLLAAHEPAPVELLRPEGSSCFVFSCEHGGRRIPEALGTLGVSEAERARHIAWDIGAAGVTRALSAILDAPAVLQRYSRLVVDCNRPSEAVDYITPLSEATEIPGNIGLSKAAIDARTRAIYRPFHDTISALLDRREAAGTATAFVPMHSFTPVYLGVARPWQLGILYDRDPRVGRILLDHLSEQSEITVGDNQPYAITPSRDYTLPVHSEQRGIPGVELEIRQDEIADEAAQQVWAERLAALFGVLEQRLRDSGAL